MIKKTVNYVADVKSEMAKVTWPTRPEITESTYIVLALTLVLSLAIFGVDRILSTGLRLLL